MLPRVAARAAGEGARMGTTPGFGVAGPADELLHPVAGDAPYALTETSYFGFNLPERRINGEIYVWFHPRLRVASAGVFCWQGMKPTALAAEYYDYRLYLPYPERQIDDYSLANGLRFRVEEPLARVELAYDDPERHTHLRLVSRAVMPPAVIPGGGHFVQAVRTEGELVLDGQAHPIDGWFTRDRSWGAPREERPYPVPPLGWLVGVFGDDFAFHVRAFDDPALGPEWAGHYAFPQAGQNLRFGYVWREGRLVALARAAKRTVRAADGLAPVAFELELEDVEGVRHPIRGEVTARLPWNTWSNVLVYMCQTRWRSGEREGYGDAQDMLFPDYVRRFSK
jgi:hypothetical protein